jgi:penicillin G amidase
MKPLHFKHARRRITVARDAGGVPHIDATSWRGALYGLGFMHALDRPTQLLFARAVASGRSAEQIADKDELVETDRFFRRAGLYLNLDHEVDRLDDDTFAELTAYCEGVNDGLKETGRSLPMWATGFTPTPWTQQAVLLVGNLLSYGGLIVSQQENERILLELVQAGVSDDKMRELFSPLIDGADFDLVRQVHMRRQLSDEALELISDLPRLAGSNAWAVRPERSATGGALMASDPHLEINRLPAIWYEVVLRWGPKNDHYVMGATLPGCPLFAVARTPAVSWGVTYLKGDTSDYFVEDCRPGGSTGWQFRRQDSWHDFSRRRETIHRKGHAPEVLDVYYNPQGTLEVTPKADAPGYYLSTCWIGNGAGAGRSIATWLEMVAADNVAEAMEVARACPLPTLSWIFADRQGNVGRQANGWFPDRPRHTNGLMPAAAWDPRNHWRGQLGPEVLPSTINPAAGFVAAANEDINTPGGPRLVTMIVPDYRRRRIDERLSDLDEARIEDMMKLQYDVVSLQARELLPVFLPHLPEGEIKRRLAGWDCSYGPQSLEATWFSRLYRNVLLEIFGQERGIGWRRMLYLATRVGFSTMLLTAIDRLLVKDESAWWQGRDKGDLIRRAAEKLDREPPEPWSITNEFHFTNRFIEDNFVGRALGFSTPPMSLPGCHATVFQGHLLKAARRETTFAPSYHFVTDMSTDEAWTNLPGGPSESRVSGWYKNDIALWHSGRYKKLSPSDPS